MPWNLVTLCAFAGMADMQMAGEDQIYTAPRKARHGHVRASNQAVKFVAFGQIEGVMGHDDARAIFAAFFQPGATPGDLPRVRSWQSMKSKPASPSARSVATRAASVECARFF